MTKQQKTVRNDDFFLAKEKLGLLSVGDPGTQDKLQVTDTFLVSAARKLDNKIKSYPNLKKSLVKVKRGAGKAKTFILRKRPTSTSHQAQQEASLSENEIHEALKSISLNKVLKPKVSIIIPVFNKVSYTIACLKSISDRINPKNNPSFEVIVVDNGSSDETHILGELKNLVFIQNSENLGFVGGCNVGFNAAKGEYVIFLNNDAEVTTNWLSTLFDTIDKDPTIGIVGSKIIYPNGVLQEAGGIIFKDADGLNYGKFDQADSYQYNYVRDVDYCSGASIIIKRSLMKKFGGFDTLYQPAYYEDTDLSFKVRKEGLRVVYQPLSVIYHIEGGTAGTSTSSGFKKYQAINKEKFFKRWKKELNDTHVSSSEHYLGRDRSGNKLALIIEEAVPTPDKDSGSRRMVAIIKSLQELGYKVTFWPNNLTPIQPYTTDLQQIGVEVVYGNIDFMQFAKLYGHAYDLVIMSRPEICAKYINICKTLFTKAKLVYDTVDLHYVRLARQAEIESTNAGYLNEQSKWYEVLEKGLMARVDTTLVVSPSEVELLKNEGVTADLEVVSNIHTIEPTSYSNTYSKRKDIIFVGNYAHLPNRDAVRWFVKDILPSLNSQLKNAKVHIVGANMPNDLAKELSSIKGIIVDGFVEDDTLVKLLSESRVFIAPLRYGAGVKGKIGQAIEHGTPVATTSIGAEGMYLKDGVSCVEANDPIIFAEKITKLYSDETFWRKVQKNASSILEDHFSPALATKSLKKIL